MDNIVLCLSFDAIDEMRKKLEPSANAYEGHIKNRIGFNFPANSAINIPELKANHKYIIGHIKGDKQTAIHEMCHALFYCDHSYKKKWLKNWKNLNDNHRRKIKKKLAHMNYPENVWIDEWQAYTQDGSNLFKNPRS